MIPRGVKKFSVALSVFFLLFGLCGVAGAVTINYLSASDGSGGFTSPYAGVTVETFNPSGPTQGWTWYGNGQFVTGSVSGQYAAPFGASAPDNTEYVAVPNNFASAPNFSAYLDAEYDYFGLWWGSVDAYNTISFYNGPEMVASFTGSDVINPNIANGNQASPPTNLYVNFLDLPAFDTFTLSSTQFAFEADNIAVGHVAAVPEPATLLLIGSGLAGLVTFRKRFRKAE